MTPATPFNGVDTQLLDRIGEAYDLLHTNCGSGALVREWRNKRSGGLYRVESVSIRETDLEALVTYKPVATPTLRLTRTVREFMERFMVIVINPGDRPYRNELPAYEALRKSLAHCAWPPGSEDTPEDDVDFDSDTLGDLQNILADFNITREDLKP